MPRFTYLDNIVALSHKDAVLFDEGLDDDIGASLHTSAIVIVTPGDEDSAPALPHINRKLYLTFDDIEDNEHISYHGRALQAINTLQAAAVASFADTAERLVVTCAGGVSRSVGVVAGILAAYNADDRSLMRAASPNMTCRRLVMRAIQALLS